MKIDLQELKRLYTDDVFQEPDKLRVTLTGSQLEALVDVVERALKYVDARVREDKFNAHIKLRTSLWPFRESPNEEA